MVSETDTGRSGAGTAGVWHWAGGVACSTIVPLPGLCHNLHVLLPSLLAGRWRHLELPPGHAAWWHLLVPCMSGESVAATRA